jgi:adenosylmethionine-8-amino-7-oxononanoate aminotransferase
MKSKTFRLSDDDVELLGYICDERGCSQAEAIRSAIRSEANAIRSDGYHGTTDGALSALAGQLAVKDAQISRLQDALDAAQETAKAAQVLHAQERRALESSEQKSRWQRLRDAWRG